MDQKENALQCMIEWLSHENELGKAPSQIQIAGEFDLHNLHYYIFKFKKSRFSSWLVGVCGGYHEDEIGHCGHIFSEYENYHEDTAQQKCINMIEQIREYWMNAANESAELKERTLFVHFVLLKDSNVNLKDVFHYLKENCHIECNQIEESKGNVYVANVKESMISVSIMETPVPEGEAEYYAQGCYMWEDAVEQVKEHKAHIIVTTSGHGIDTREAMLLQSQLIDACFNFEQSIAVYGDEMVWPKHIYRDIMNDYYQDESLPVMLWVYLGIVTNQEGNHIYTIGLKNFGHYEIETLPTTIQLSELHEFMFNVICYIIEQRAELHQGETIGVSATQKCQITLSQGIFLDEKTLKIEVVDIE